jgi:YidC/Oxa1 family membrane protein insertase
MTVTSILSAVYNQNQSGMSNQQPGMQYMPYIMPVMLMFMFNGFPAALTYYYLLQNVLTCSTAVGYTEVLQLVRGRAAPQDRREYKKNPTEKSGLYEEAGGHPSSKQKVSAEGIF